MSITTTIAAAAATVASQRLPLRTSESHALLEAMAIVNISAAKASFTKNSPTLERSAPITIASITSKAPAKMIIVEMFDDISIPLFLR